MISIARLIRLRNLVVVGRALSRPSGTLSRKRERGFKDGFLAQPVPGLV